MGGIVPLEINLNAIHDIFDLIHITQHSWDFGYILDPYPNSENVVF